MFKIVRFISILLLLLTVIKVNAQLAAGDIAIVQYNADGTSDFAFVCLVDIPGSEVIKFTDNEHGDLAGGEGTIEWTAPAEGVACGTIITVTTSPSATTGTVTETNDLNFSTNGDGLIAYQGTTGSPTYITALGNDGNTAGSYGDAQEGALPTGLTLGTNAQSIAEVDNAKYDASLVNDTKANLLTSIYDHTNWTTSNTTNQTYSTAITVTSCTTKDSDSQIQASATLSEPASISSLNDSNTEWVDVFDFTFADLGTTDGLATILEQFLITQGSANDVVDWTDAIAGARINGPDQTNLAGTVNATSITFSGADFISIADGASEEYTLSIYLNTDLSNVSDNDNLEFRMNNTDITTDVTGSSFGTGDIESGDANIAIDINATELTFTTIPSSAENSTNFTVKVSATDVNGNIDLDETSSITLALATGAGTLSSGTGLTQNLVSGEYTWSDVQHNTNETITIEAQCASLTNVTSGNIDIYANVCILSETFGGDLSNWSNTDDWTVNTGEMQHSHAAIDDESYISSNVGSIDLTVGDFEWNVCMRNGAWDPSSDNDFAMTLISDITDLLGTNDGYAVGVNKNGTTDEIMLYRIDNGTYTTLITAGATDWGISDDICIRVTRTSTGTWELFYDTGGGETSAGTTSETTYTTGQFTGITFDFTSTRVNELWVDDLSMCYQQTCTSPTVQPNSMVFSSVTTTGFDISWTDAGNGNAQLVVVKADNAITSNPISGTSYTANTVFSSGDDIGLNSYIVYAADAGPVSVSGLGTNQTYHVSIFEYNTGDNCYNITSPLTGSQSTLCNDPTTQASGYSATSIAASTATINWTRGNGSDVLVVVKEGGAVDADPTDGTSYTANAAFGSGTQIGTGNYVVYSGTGTSVNLTSLNPNTTYHVGIYEFNTATICYNETELIGNFTTYANSSDVIAVASSESATIPSTTNDATPLASTEGVQIWQFTVRDGGGAADGDPNPTIVNNITITQSAGNSVSAWDEAIQSVDLFDGATHLATGTVNATNIVFSGLAESVADNTNKTFSLRLSLNCGFGSSNADNQDFGFQIANTDIAVTGTSSEFSAFAAPSSADGQNVINVTADRLTFTTQPSSISVNNKMAPFVVAASDACGNPDSDFAGNITITSSGTLDGSSTTVVAIASGSSTFNNIIHSVTGTGLTLTASTGGGLSDKVSSTFDVSTPTDFTPGDFAIIAVNTNTGTGDEVCFISFQNIVGGTVFQMTDNGYERVTTGLWGNTEGAIEFTYAAAAPTIASGSVICIEGHDVTFDGDGLDGFDIYVCGTKDDPNWSLSTLTDKGTNQFNLNNTDQIWFLQGGTWTHNTNNGQDDTYDGATLYGWTASGWEATAGYNSTSGSTEFNSTRCYNTDVDGKVNEDRVKYTGTKTGTKRALINAINNSANWTDYADNTAYNATAAAYDYQNESCTNTGFTITAATEVPGKWDGSQNAFWNDCRNWDDLIIPDQSINVTLTSGMTNDPSITTTGAECNTLNIPTGTTLTINNTGELSVYGDFDNDGTLTHTAGGVIMAGTTSTTITGDNAIDFYNFTINKSSGDVTLGRAIDISNSATFTSGVLNTTAANIINFRDNATVSGGSNSSHVDGPVRKTGNDAFIFPAGDAGKWSRIGITAPDDAADAFTAQYFKSGYGDYTVDATLNNVSRLEYWDLTETNDAGAGNSINITLYWEDASFSEIDAYTADLVVAHFTGGNWIDAGQSAITAASPGNVTSNAVTTFSPFGFGSKGAGSNPLPIELLSFEGELIDNSVELKWKSASEINNDYFQIEKSMNAVDFEKIGTVLGNGNTSSLTSYTYIDEKPYLNKNNYYRLRQIDYNGTTTLSKIISINTKHITNSETYLYLYNDRLYLQSPETIIKIEIFNSLGQLVYTENNIDKQDIIQLDNKLQPGVYFIKTLNEFGEIQAKKMKL